MSKQARRRRPMKCPACWAGKAYRRNSEGWFERIASSVLTALKCHHCYHRFRVVKLRTWGRSLDPPVAGPRLATSTRPSYAAQETAARRTFSGSKRQPTRLVRPARRAA